MWQIGMCGGGMHGGVGCGSQRACIVGGGWVAEGMHGGGEGMWWQGWRACRRDGD